MHEWESGGSGSGPPEDEGGRSVRVLVVDDEPDVRAMLQRLIARCGWEPLVADSGLEALVVAQQEAPDLVLLDIMMHPMDGWETLRLMRLDERTREIPVVIVSARAEPRDKIRALQEGATDYVTKPFALREIRQKLEGILGTGATPGATADRDGSPA